MCDLFFSHLHRHGLFLLVLVCTVLFSNCKSEVKPNNEAPKVEHSDKSETQIDELKTTETAYEPIASKNKKEVLKIKNTQNSNGQTKTDSNEQTSESLESIKVIDKHLYNSKIDYSNIDKYYLISLIEERLNNQRMSKGLPKLYQRRNLKDAAQDQNDYVNQLSSLTHTQEDPNKNTVRDRVSHHGGRYMKVGENIQYYGFLNNDVNGEVFIFPPDYSEAADDIMKVWNESPGHYKNMMDEDFSSVGTALDWNADLKAIFVTQVYGG